jgi:DNA-binding NtrC family response regulator
LFGGVSSAPKLHPSTLDALRNHSWPGNIRQLQKVLCRAACTARGSEIMPADLDFGETEMQSSSAAGIDEAGARSSLRRAVAWAWQSSQPDLWPLLQQLLECELLRYAQEQPGISQVQLARRLGIARNTLRARHKQYGLQAPDEEP